MKTVFFSAILLFSLTATAATHLNPVNEKVIKTFNEIFKNVSTPTWRVFDNYYEASFVNASVKTRVWFDRKGHLVQTIRYYTESGLPANVLFNVKLAYREKEVFGVVEISNDSDTSYRIILKDKKTYTHISMNTLGETEIVAEYNRGDK